MCEEAKLYYYDCLCEESCGLIPQSASNHIERCRHCQKQINRLKVVLSQKDFIESEQRQNSSAVTTMLELHFAYIDKYVTCDTVRPFLPGMLDPAIEIRIPTPITAHLDNCQKCTEDLGTLQKLNLNSTQLYGLSRFFAKGYSPDTTEYSEIAASVTAMAERADSEIVTIYHVDESGKARKAGESQDLYAGFPIRVEVIKQKVDDEQPAPTLNFAAALREKVSAMNLGPFIKIGVAAVAVILIGFALLLNTPSAKAVTLEKIYKAIKLVKNVHILKSVPDETGLLTKIIEEKWVSRTLDIYMLKSETGFVLWDVPNIQIKSKRSEAGEIEMNQLAEDDIPVFKQIISGSAGIMPFDDISQIPPGSQWQRKDDEISEAAEGIEIYELILPKRKYSGSSGFKIWRVFADAKKSLPQKVEWYTKLDDAELLLETVMVIEYLDDNQMQKAVKEAGF